MKKLSSKPFVQGLLAVLLANYLRLVRITTLWTYLPKRPDEVMAQNAPVIVAMWHGQHFMIPTMKKKHWPFAVMISAHRDGEMNARAVEAFGFEAVRASGGTSFSGKNKGGARGFLQLLGLLQRSVNVAMTADVPKVSRVAGLGIVTLAKHSGRPILPLAVVCKHRKDFQSWDKASIGLPFGRGVMAYGEPIYVPSDAEDLEEYRQNVETQLALLHQNAYGHLGCEDPGGKRLEA